MSGNDDKLPQRSRKRVEVRHRAGTGEFANQPKGPPVVGRIKEDRGEEARRLAGLNDRRRGSGRKREEPVPAWAIAVVSTVTLGLIVGIVWYTIGRLGRTNAGGVLTAEELRQAPAEAADQGLMGTLSPDELLTTIEETVKGFMDAESDGGRCGWVSGGRAMEERMTRFYAREGNAPPDGFGRIREHSSLAFGGFLMQVVVAEEKESGRPFAFNVFPAKERMLIDWESSTGHGEMGWEEFQEEKPVEATQMRVFLKSDAYYNYEFADDKKYACYRVTARDSGEPLYGYAERDSETGRRLAEVVVEGATVPANLRLRFLPGQKDGSMVFIDSCLHLYWVDPDSLGELVQER